MPRRRAPIVVLLLVVLLALAALGTLEPSGEEVARPGPPARVVAGGAEVVTASTAARTTESAPVSSGGAAPARSASPTKPARRGPRVQRLEVEVVDAGGAPVRDAEVVLVQRPRDGRARSVTLEARTDARGRVGLDVDADASHFILQARAGGVRSEERSPSREEERAGIRLVLPEPCAILGAVVDVDGHRLPGVRVRLHDRFGSEVETDAAGRFRFEGLPECRHTVSVVDEEGGSGTTVAEPGGGPPLRLVVRRPVVLEGSVRCADGSPPTEPFVRLDGPVARLDGERPSLEVRDGAVVFRSSDQVDGPVRIQAAGFDAAGRPCVAWVVVEPRGPGPVPVALTLEPAGAIRARLQVAEPSLLSMSWERVAGGGPRDGSGRGPNGEGLVSTGWLPPGPYRVVLEDPRIDQVVEARQVEVRAGETLELVLGATGSRPGSEASAALEGHVVVSPSRGAVHVGLFGAQGGIGFTYAEDDHTFAFPFLAPGEWLVVATRLESDRGRDGYRHLAGRLPVRLQPGERLTGVEVRLEPVARIVGRLVDEAGRPVPAATVLVWPGEAGQEGKRRTDAEGRFVLGEVVPGACPLRLADEDLARVARRRRVAATTCGLEVEVRSGATAEVVLRVLDAR